MNSVLLIKFTYEDKNITLVIDPNDTKIMTYKDIRKLCEKTNIEFSNQSFGSIVSQLKEKFFNAESIRHKFTKEERKQIFEKNSSCKMCKKSSRILIFILIILKLLQTVEQMTPKIYKFCAKNAILKKHVRNKMKDMLKHPIH